MSKQLSMKTVKEDTKKFKEQIEFPVLVGNEEYTVRFKPYFAPKLVKKLVDDMTLFFQAAKKEKLNVLDEEFDDIVGYFIVKHFSDIKMTTSKKAKSIYEEFHIAIDSPLFEVILSTIPEESVLSVHKRIQDSIELGAKLESRLKEKQQEIQELPLIHKNILLKEEKQIPEA